MKKRNLFVTLLCLVAIVMGLKLNAFADLGNFNDYSSGSSGAIVEAMTVATVVVVTMVVAITTIVIQMTAT